MKSTKYHRAAFQFENEVCEMYFHRLLFMCKFIFDLKKKTTFQLIDANESPPNQARLPGDELTI